MRRRDTLSALALGLFLTGPAMALTLVDNGKSDARIWIKADAPKDTQDAAAELARVIERMSGAALPVTPVAGGGEIDPKAPGIALDAVAVDLGLKMDQTSRARDGFRFAVRGPRLLIVAESPRGVYIAVSRLLETLGCGWYAPGDVGEVIPTLRTLSLPDALDRAEVSNSINRRFWYGGKNGAGAPTQAWLRRINGDFQCGSWSHAYAHLIPKDVLKEHPEYGSLNRGKRTTKQLCTTNPEVIRIAADTLMKDMQKPQPQFVFAAGPNDGGGLCECPECAKLDTPGYLEPSSGKPACSDRIFRFAADIAAITAQRFPDRDLGILVYSEYSRIPLKVDRVSPNVFPMIAPIRRCRIHGPGNPVCEMNKLWQEEIRGWARLSPKLGFYMYNYNLADSLLPLSKTDFYKRIADEVNRANIEQLAWIFESIDTWSAHAPLFYLSVRLSWNSHLDVDREMERFYSGFYGAAADPMRSYWTRLDRVYASVNSHSGSSYGMHKFWTPDVLKASRADLDRAAQLAANPREKDAVAMAEAGLRSAEIYMTVWNAIGRCDFAAAAQAQLDLAAHCKQMSERPDPHWAHLRYAYDQYYRNFVGKVVDAGAKALSGGGKLAVRLPDIWRFSLDEKAVGVEQGWWKPDFAASGWRDIGAFSTCWADEGLPWYQGDAWYRATFTVPADFKGKDLRLWFGGFDNNVDVYLNGQHLGEKTGFVKPQEFEDVAKHLNFGGANLLAVRVSAGSLAEIGTGGIMMPVMLYQPGATSATPDAPKTTAPGYQM